ncbi:hypothetical protein [uncultured Umboniibacter sp.]|uniref:hypothetical protein n=1 Tax=uncultured Umboniibacter sp. TaxID=1798917 RepID=UPI00262F562D|nr:hypothetical protein [uncultured Umboniibacter sp.]
MEERARKLTRVLSRLHRRIDCRRQTTGQVDASFEFLATERELRLNHRLKLELQQAEGLLRKARVTAFRALAVEAKAVGISFQRWRRKTEAERALIRRDGLQCY